jgi:hypothetical protein
MINAMYIDADCPNCYAPDSIHCIFGMEADGDESGIWYAFDYKIERQDCNCDLPRLDLLDELREVLEEDYKETYQPEY